MRFLGLRNGRRGGNTGYFEGGLGEEEKSGLWRVHGAGARGSYGGRGARVNLAMVELRTWLGGLCLAFRRALRDLRVNSAEGQRGPITLRLL